MQPLEDQMIHGCWPRWHARARIANETVLVPQAVAIGVLEDVKYAG